MAVRTDTVLGHTIVRAALTWGNGTGTWDVVKVTPRAARVAAFIGMWAATMRDEGVGDGELSPEVYAKSGYESRPSTYRRLHDYGELWPEIDINEMGRLVLAAADSRQSKLDLNVRVKLPVLAA